MLDRHSLGKYLTYLSKVYEGGTVLDRSLFTPSIYMDPISPPP